MEDSRLYGAIDLVGLARLDGTLSSVELASLVSRHKTLLRRLVLLFKQVSELPKTVPDEATKVSSMLIATVSEESALAKEHLSWLKAGTFVIYRSENCLNKFLYVLSLVRKACPTLRLFFSDYSGLPIRLSAVKPFISEMESNYFKSAFFFIYAICDLLSTEFREVSWNGTSVFLLDHSLFECGASLGAIIRLKEVLSLYIQDKSYEDALLECSKPIVSKLQVAIPVLRKRLPISTLDTMRQLVAALDGIKLDRRRLQPLKKVDQLLDDLLVQLYYNGSKTPNEASFAVEIPADVLSISDPPACKVLSITSNREGPRRKKPLYSKTLLSKMSDLFAKTTSSVADALAAISGDEGFSDYKDSVRPMMEWVRLDVDRLSKTFEASRLPSSELLFNAIGALLTLVEFGLASLDFDEENTFVRKIRSHCAKLWASDGRSDHLFATIAKHFKKLLQGPENEAFLRFITAVCQAASALFELSFLVYSIVGFRELVKESLFYSANYQALTRVVSKRPDMWKMLTFYSSYMNARLRLPRPLSRAFSEHWRQSLSAVHGQIEQALAMRGAPETLLKEVLCSARLWIRLYYDSTETFLNTIIDRAFADHTYPLSIVESLFVLPEGSGAEFVLEEEDVPAVDGSDSSGDAQVEDEDELFEDQEDSIDPFEVSVEDGLSEDDSLAICSCFNSCCNNRSYGTD